LEITWKAGVRPLKLNLLAIFLLSWFLFFLGIFLIIVYLPMLINPELYYYHGAYEGPPGYFYDLAFSWGALLSLVASIAFTSSYQVYKKRKQGS